MHKDLLKNTTYFEHQYQSLGTDPYIKTLISEDEHGFNFTSKILFSVI